MQSGRDDGAIESGLIRRVVAADDHAAFARLVRMHQSPVRQFLRRLCRQDVELAEDLAQDTFWKAYRHLRSYRGEGRFLSWLFKIAFQLFVTQERRRKKVEFTELAVDPAADIVEGEQVVLNRTVDQLLGRLRDEEKAAVLLHYRHGLTQQEIAAALGQPLGTVKSLIRRAREKMKQHYDSRSEEPSCEKSALKTNSG